MIWNDKVGFGPNMNVGRQDWRKSAFMKDYTNTFCIIVLKNILQQFQTNEFIFVNACV